VVFCRRRVGHPLLAGQRVPTGAADGRSTRRGLLRLLWEAHGKQLAGFRRAYPPYRDPKIGPLHIALFDQKQTAFAVSVRCVDGVEQTRALDQPGFELAVHVQYKDEVLRLEITPNRRVVPSPGRR
jgi:hypothetical protein